MLYVFSFRAAIIFALVLFLFYSCKTSGPGLLGKKTPHEQYSDRLTNAGLRSTVLGNSWFKVAAQSISTPLTVTIPYAETGYFSDERPSAAGLRFNVVRGQKLLISLERKPLTNFAVYLDLWKDGEGSEPKHITAADTSSYSIQHEVSENAEYILRLQPELLSSGEYTISITAGPTLAYPIKAPGKNHIRSFWGAARDGGSRKHEGIDMFAALRTPIVAAAEGRITRVNETAVGGKVVWLRVKDKDYTLYYAHLDTQFVTDGENVQIGDTLGLMGNTGNARTTAPHLHFGVYTFNGPVDPLPFVKPVELVSEKITAPMKLLGQLARVNHGSPSIYSEPDITSAGAVNIENNTILRIDALTSSWLKVSLPNGQQAFIKAANVKELAPALRTLKLKESLPLLEKPDSMAAKKTSIPAGESTEILGNFGNYYFVRAGNRGTGWITK